MCRESFLTVAENEPIHHVMKITWIYSFPSKSTNTYWTLVINIPGTERRLIKEGELSLWNLLLKKDIRISIRVKREMMRKKDTPQCMPPKNHRMHFSEKRVHNKYFFCQLVRAWKGS